ncbi:MAG: hypothetical protein ABR501_00235, partial [Pyrinomonadaceae bacterium]
IELKLAGSDDHAQWCALYAEGFARTGKAADVDRDRWRKSFGHPDVLHWFLVQNGRSVGVCQTCIANGVAGIYSFTLLPGYRSVGRLITALRSVRAEILLRCEEIIYFERVRNRVAIPLRKPMIFGSFKTIRKFLAYRKI